MKEIVELLSELTSCAEGGFLDEIPSFKPDCYYHPLIRKAAQILVKLDPNALDEHTKRIIEDA